MKFFLILIFFPIIASSQSQKLIYKWRKISGPSQYKIVSPDSAVTQVTDLTTGVYQFELKVTNSKGLSSSDTMKLTVSPPANDPYANKNKTTSVSLGEPKNKL